MTGRWTLNNTCVMDYGCLINRSIQPSQGITKQQNSDYVWPEWSITFSVTDSNCKCKTQGDEFDAGTEFYLGDSHHSKQIIQNPLHYTYRQVLQKLRDYTKEHRGESNLGNFFWCSFVYPSPEWQFLNELSVQISSRMQQIALIVDWP